MRWLLSHPIIFFYYGLCVKNVNSCTFILTLGTRKTKKKSNLNDAKNICKGVLSIVKGKGYRGKYKLFA